MERRDAAESGEAVLRHAREGGALEADPVRRLARLVRQADGAGAERREGEREGERGGGDSDSQGFCFEWNK